MNDMNRKINAVWTRSNALYAKAAALLGVGYPEMMVLYALETMGELTQKEIAERFGMQKQTVNSVVRALTKRGMLQLVAGRADKREKLLVLTDSGRDYAHTIISPLRRIEDKLYETIGEEKLQAMYETLDLFNLLLERALLRGLHDES